jgi:hypothetical protein
VWALPPRFLLSEEADGQRVERDVLFGRMECQVSMQRLRHPEQQTA